MFKPIQNRIYGDIYVFKDEDENMEGIDERYKSISNGIKNFLRQKKGT